MWAYVYMYVCTQVSGCVCISMYMFMNGHSFRHRLRPIKCACTNAPICGPIRKHF